jgi:hypothetical protein
MAQELSGSMRRNTKKESERHPDMNGSCLIEGVEYWISGWAKEGNDGRWLSLSFKPKDEAKAPAAPMPEDDDLPF